MVTGASPGYLPLLFSYSVCIYIGCVVLQWCLRSHCGISKSQMVNLIPTCLVSSIKNYFKMILLNSENQCIYMYKGRRAAAAAVAAEEE
jgi:hypothetical protein